MDSLKNASLVRKLADDPLDDSGVITLSPALGAEALSYSVIATRASLMLGYAYDHDGIGLTKSGALNRKFLAWAVEAFHWPGYEAEEIYALNRVVDEIDYPPGWYLHEVMRRQKFFRKHKDRLLISPAGRAAFDRPGFLQRALFIETFKGRHLRSLDAAFMSDFDLYFGLLLWEVRNAAETWTSARELFQKSVSPDDAVHDMADRFPDSPIHGFYLRVLRFLCWFGLLEQELPHERRFDADRHRYRVTRLFDQFVSFGLTETER